MVPSYMRSTCKLTSRKMTSNKRICEVVALEGNLNLLKSYIEEQNYDPKQKGTGGSTLLHYACVGGHLDVVKYLLDEHQLDPLYENDAKKSSLYAALLVNKKLHYI